MRKTYIIGEIGQNHNGSVDIAKLIIELICRPIEEDVFGLDLQPMDAVKMTRRDLKEELTVSQMNRPYNTPNSLELRMGNIGLTSNWMTKPIMKYIDMPNPKGWILSKPFVLKGVFLF